MTYSYYMTQRPPMIGAMPKEGLYKIDEYNGKQRVEAIGMEAWAKLEYDRELTDKEISDYELIPELYDLQLTRGTIKWLCYRLEDSECFDDKEHVEVMRLIRYLNSVISR